MYRKFLKRFMDFLLSLIAISVLLPFFLIFILCVRINLGSPVFFKQKRVGKDGKTFEMLKFRTMRDAVEVATGKKLTDEQRLNIVKEKGIEYVTSDTERLTKFGRILRKFSIDELPELINILKGDMSIVGPRPLVEIYLPYYSDEEKQRHNVRPGLTGWAQVNGRNAISWKKRFEYDVEYVKKVTFWRDIHIIWKTVMVVFDNSGIAQGEEKPIPFHVERQREWDEKKAKVL